MLRIQLTTPLYPYCCSLMETVKTLRLFMFMAFICHILHGYTEQLLQCDPRNTNTHTQPGTTCNLH